MDVSKYRIFFHLTIVMGLVLHQGAIFMVSTIAAIYILHLTHPKNWEWALLPIYAAISFAQQWINFRRLGAPDPWPENMIWPTASGGFTTVKLTSYWPAPNYNHVTNAPGVSLVPQPPESEPDDLVFQDVAYTEASASVDDTNNLMIINKSGITIRMAVQDLRVMGRATQGVKLINIKGKDSIAAVAKVMREEDEDIEDLEEGTSSENGTEIENDTSNDHQE